MRVAQRGDRGQVRGQPGRAGRRRRAQERHRVLAQGQKLLLGLGAWPYRPRRHPGRLVVVVVQNRR
jgi:hypothetical protein